MRVPTLAGGRPRAGASLVRGAGLLILFLASAAAPILPGGIAGAGRAEGATSVLVREYHLDPSRVRVSTTPEGESVWFPGSAVDAPAGAPAIPILPAQAVLPDGFRAGGVRA